MWRQILLRPHKLVLILVLSLPPAVGGCSSRAPADPSFSEEKEVPKEHEHKAPHGGSLIELGEEFAHVEVVIDNEKTKVTAYVLDGEAEQPVRIKQPELQITVDPPGLTLKLAAVANLMTGETVGDTSEFAVPTEWLKLIADGRDATLREITVRGSTFENVPFKLGTN
jgi:hypothetical protein